MLLLIELVYSILNYDLYTGSNMLQKWLTLTFNYENCIIFCW